MSIPIIVIFIYRKAAIPINSITQFRSKQFKEGVA